MMFIFLTLSDGSEDNTEHLWPLNISPDTRAFRYCDDCRLHVPFRTGKQFTEEAGPEILQDPDLEIFLLPDNISSCITHFSGVAQTAAYGPW
jgi:hypothetical protein